MSLLFVPLSCCHAPYGSLAPAMCRYYCLPHKTALMISCVRCLHALSLLTLSGPSLSMLPCSPAAVLLTYSVRLTCCCHTYMLLSYVHAAVMLTYCCPALVRRACSHAAVMLTCCCTAPVPVLLINGCPTLLPVKLMWCSLAHAAVLRTCCCLAHIRRPCSPAAALLTCCCSAHLLLSCAPAAVLLSCCCSAHLL